MSKERESVKLYTTTLQELKKLKESLHLKSVNETLQHLIQYFKSDYTLQSIAASRAQVRAQKQHVLQQCTAINQTLDEFTERIAVLSANNGAVMKHLLSETEATPAATVAAAVKEALTSTITGAIADVERLANQQ